MPDLTPAYDLLAKLLPFECMQMGFMQRALLGLLLLAPMSAAMGVQVVNFRMAFFADAISHSAFTGVAIGLILGVDPQWTMPVFGLLVGLCIMWTKRRSSLANDTVIGVFFSGVIAFGIAVVSRNKNVARNVQKFLYGDILTISDSDIWAMIALFVVLLVFQAYGYNRMLYVGLNPTLAQTHAVRVAAYQFIYAALLSLVVIFSVWAVGVLLVTAMLIVPSRCSKKLCQVRRQYDLVGCLHKYHFSGDRPPDLRPELGEDFYGRNGNTRLFLLVPYQFFRVPAVPLQIMMRIAFGMSGWKR